MNGSRRLTEAINHRSLLIIVRNGEVDWRIDMSPAMLGKVKVAAAGGRGRAMMQIGRDRTISASVR